MTAIYFPEQRLKTRKGFSFPIGENIYSATRMGFFGFFWTSWFFFVSKGGRLTESTSCLLELALDEPLYRLF